MAELYMEKERQQKIVPYVFIFVLCLLYAFVFSMVIFTLCLLLLHFFCREIFFSPIWEVFVSVRVCLLFFLRSTEQNQNKFIFVALGISWAGKINFPTIKRETLENRFSSLLFCKQTKQIEKAINRVKRENFFVCYFYCLFNCCCYCCCRFLCTFACAGDRIEMFMSVNCRFQRSFRRCFVRIYKRVTQIVAAINLMQIQFKRTKQTLCAVDKETNDC